MALNWLSSSASQDCCISYSLSRVSGSEAVSCWSSVEDIHLWYLKGIQESHSNSKQASFLTGLNSFQMSYADMLLMQSLSLSFFQNLSLSSLKNQLELKYHSSNKRLKFTLKRGESDTGPGPRRCRQFSHFDWFSWSAFLFWRFEFHWLLWIRCHLWLSWIARTFLFSFINYQASFPFSSSLWSNI